MTSRYSTPPSNLRSLRDRLTQTAKRQGVLFGRLQQHVAVLVVAQIAAAASIDSGQPALLIKGGTSLELRRGIADSRTSKDLDAVTRHDLDAVHARFREAAAVGWEGFTGVITPMDEINVPGLQVAPRRFAIRLSYRGRPFATVPIEVSAVEAGNAERFDEIPVDTLELVGLPSAAAVPCMTVPWQIAQKLHACTTTSVDGSHNDRAHDLVDLQILEALVGDATLAEVRAACLAVFAARRQQAWPPQIVAPPHWPAIYLHALEGLGHLDLAQTVDAAALAVAALVARIDDAR